MILRSGSAKKREFSKSWTPDRERSLILIQLYTEGPDPNPKLNLFKQKVTRERIGAFLRLLTPRKLG